MLIDSHCHLDYFAPDELPAVLSRAAEAGVGEMVTIGTSLAQSARLPALAESHPQLWCTIGVHPHHAAEAPVPEPETLASSSAWVPVLAVVVVLSTATPCTSKWRVKAGNPDASINARR